MTGIMVKPQGAGAFPVGSKARYVSRSLVRPADTNAYAAGDAVGLSTTAADNLILVFDLKSASGSGFIQEALLIDGANVSTKPDLQLWLFDRPITMDADNAVFTPTEDELMRLVTVIAFPTGAFVVGDATSGVGGNAVCDAQSLWIPFSLDDGCTSLYGVVVVRNAYVPVSAETFTFRLAILD